ncbi:MAG: DUF3592 domain-containing protein [Clostridia bacterium]|nr:DUF3592 domain-containing protein [Clostridia bacterium]
MSRKKSFGFMWVPIGLVLICFVSGIALLWLGIDRKAELDARIKGYTQAEGYFADVEIYNVDKDGKVTYTLLYSFEADGKEYTARTDFGTEAVPDIGYANTVYYDPDEPANNVVGEVRGPEMTIAMGIFFILGSSVFIFIGLSVWGLFDKCSFNMTDIFIGFVVLIMGMGGIYIITEGFSLRVLFMLAGPFGIIPVLFMLMGVHLICRGVFHKNQKGRKQ